MSRDVDARCLEIGAYIARTGDTVRGAARQFHISKSTVHKDMHARLKLLHPGLYQEVRQVLSFNRSVRHIRGGDATRAMYAHKKTV